MNPFRTGSEVLFILSLVLMIGLASGLWITIGAILITIATVMFAYSFFAGDGLIASLRGQNSRAFRDAAIGVATVKGVSQTGTYINEQPQVRIDVSVEAADGKTFDSYAKLIVPLTDLGAIRPGIVLPVRYLPERLDRVEIDLSNDQSAMQRVYNESLIRKGLTSPEMIAIADSGVRANGVVRTMTVPGEIRHGWPQVVLDVAVTHPDGSMFTTQTTKYIAPNAIGNIQVGKVVDVRYKPDNESLIAFSIPANQ